MREVRDHRHHRVRGRRDVDAGAGLVRHSGTAFTAIVLGHTAYVGASQAAAPASRVRPGLREAVRSDDERATLAAHRLGRGRVGQQRERSGRPRPAGSPDGEHKPVTAVPDGLRRAARTADDHRQPAGRRLERGQPEALGVQPAQPGPHRQGEHVGPLQLAHHRRGPSGPGEPDRVPESQPCGQRRAAGPAAGRRRPGPAPAARVRPVRPAPAARPVSRCRSPSARRTGRPRRTAAGPGLRRASRAEQVGSTGGGSRSSRSRAAGLSAGRDPTVGDRPRWWSDGRTPSPIRRSSGAGPGQRGPPDLVTVGQRDDPLGPGPAQGRGEQAERGGGPEDHPAWPRNWRISSAARRGRPRGGQQHAPVADHRVTAVDVSPLRPGGPDV